MLALVVMEHGGAWPGHVGDCAGVIAFTRTGDELLQRTHEKVDSLARAHQVVRLAVLACNGEMSREAHERRIQVGRALLAAVAGTRFGRLVLSADQHASRSLREELFSLVAALGEQVRGTSTTIALRFSDGSEAGSASPSFAP